VPRLVGTRAGACYPAPGMLLPAQHQEDYAATVRLLIPISFVT